MHAFQSSSNTVSSGYLTPVDPFLWLKIVILVVLMAFLSLPRVSTATQPHIPSVTCHNTRAPASTSCFRCKVTKTLCFLHFRPLFSCAPYPLNLLRLIRSLRSNTRHLRCGGCRLVPVRNLASTVRKALTVEVALAMGSALFRFRL